MIQMPLVLNQAKRRQFETDELTLKYSIIRAWKTLIFMLDEIPLA